jgi:MFS family permease
MFKQYRKLPMSVYIIVLASIINSMGNFVRPFLTTFLTDRIGMSSSDAGTIVTISIGLYLPAALIGGKLVDTYGRKKVLIIFNLLSATAFIICGLSFNPLIFIILVLCSSFSISAASPAASAMMADITNEENRNAAFSLQYFGHNLGFALGSMIAGFLYKNYASLIFLEMLSQQ